MILIKRIAGLTQDSGIHCESDKGQYTQYRLNEKGKYEEDFEVTTRLQKYEVEIILNHAFDPNEKRITIEEGINKYEEEKLKNAINIFWHKNFLKKEPFDEYDFPKDYSINDPKFDLIELSRENFIYIEHLIFSPERKHIRFYLGGTEIYLKNKAFDDLMKKF